MTPILFADFFNDLIGGACCFGFVLLIGAGQAVGYAIRAVSSDTAKDIAKDVAGEAAKSWLEDWLDGWFGK